MDLLGDFISDCIAKSEKSEVFIKDGSTTVSYGETEQLLAIGSKYITQRQLNRKLVCVFLPNSFKIILADFSLVYSGSIFLNIDFDTPKIRIKNLLESVKPDAIIVDDCHFSDVFDDLEIEIIQYTTIFHPPDEVLPSVNCVSSATIDVDPVCLITTSGSTGTPKAATLSHRSLLDFIKWFLDEYSFAEKQIVGSLSPLHFDGYIPGLFSALATGGSFVILKRTAAMFPIELVSELNENYINFIFWVPTSMIPIFKNDIFNSMKPKFLKFIGFAGEVLPANVLEYWVKHLGDATFINFYGPIEISVICSHYRIPLGHDFSQPIPIGYPCGNTRIEILNDGHLVKQGEVGELYVEGAGVGLGYWNDAQKSSEAFFDIEFSKKYFRRFYKTGDLAIRDESGVLHFKGRIDYQVKHSGYRIALNEIEAVISENTPLSMFAVVYDFSNKEICLFYSAENTIQRVDFFKKLIEFLPKYMIPTRIEKLKDFPLNSSGKIDRKKLGELVTNG